MSRVEEFELPIEPFGESPRKIWVYLPDSYDHSENKYDVLYMFDGHNLFFDETATYGKSWGMKEYLDETGIDLVVIGQDCNHTGDGRMNEYCPMPPVTSNWWEGVAEPCGERTAEWFAYTLKPECERRYRIHSGREHVGIGGSSMGGLMAEYCVTKYNDVYSKAACVSPATYYNFQDLMDLIGRTDFADSRIYLDLGSNETGMKEELVFRMDLMLQMNHAYEQKGCSTYPHLVVNGTHSEASWETIVPVFLEYLYPDLY